MALFRIKFRCLSYMREQKLFTPEVLYIKYITYKFDMREIDTLIRCVFTGVILIRNPFTFIIVM